MAFVNVSDGWTNRTVPGMWVQFYNSLGGGDAADKGPVVRSVGGGPPESFDEFMNFCGSSLTQGPAPGFVLALGIIISLVTCVALKRFCGPQQIYARGEPKRPSRWPVLLVCVPMILLLWIGAFYFVQRNHASFTSVHGRIGEVIDDVRLMDAHCVTLMGIGSQLNGNINGFWQSCDPMLRQVVRVAGATKEIEQFERDASNESTMLIAEMQKTHIDLQTTVSELYEAQDGYADSEATLFLIIVAPVTIALVFLIMVSVSLLAMHDYSHECLTSLADVCVVQVGPFIVGLSIFCVAIVVAIQIGAATKGGLFCANPDGYSLAVVDSKVGINSTEYHTASHYITGRGVNPLEADFATALDTIRFTKSSLGRAALTFLDQFCAAIKAKDLANVSIQVETIVYSAIALTESARVQTYYNDIMVDGLCGTQFESFGWLVTLELLVGFVGLPLMGMSIYRYMLSLFQCEDMSNFENAIQSGDVELALELSAALRESGMINATTKHGRVPLTLAMNAHAPREVLTGLLEAGAEIDLKDGYGESAVDVAVRAGRVEELMMGHRGLVMDDEDHAYEDMALIVRPGR